MNRKQIAVLILLALMSGACDTANKTNQRAMPQDPHSFSSPVDARVRHLNWNAEIDFDAKVIRATAVWDIEQLTDAGVIVFDTKDLLIENVWLDDQVATTFTAGDRDEILGQSLTISLQPGTKQITIVYSTGAGAEALQWLGPQQTAGKKHPFLFTQSQAILARSWVPCQDTPGVRFTYEAEVSVPRELLALMSASNSREKNANGRYSFSMKQAIPSYLLALTVGDLEFSSVSERSGVYAEPSLIGKAAWEFADLEKMIAAAEKLYGPYQWERYDVIVLPPSFPFGGMENPKLTFATPTILSGDRSLTSLIAHELAHSWSGNLVTNATWNDFWLNEGFTVYFEHRIMEVLYGRDYAEMLASLALQDLRETIKELSQQNQSDDTRLKLSLEGRNPDDGVTDIAYNKGYFFLRSIEEKYGREKFDRFLNAYFSEKAFTSVTTDDFIAFIRSFYRERFGIDIPERELSRWIFEEGLPTDHPVPSSDRFPRVERVIEEWKTSPDKSFPVTREWTTHEWLHFLKNLPAELTREQMSDLARLGGFTESENAEIVTAWLVRVVRNSYEPAYPKLEAFLINTGRRKFLSPIYNELVRTPEGMEMAKRIYQKARPNYHFVATNTFDKLIR